MSDGSMRKCKVCGKDIFIGNLEEYVFKRKSWAVNTRGMIYFCGWNCMRVWEKEHPEPEVKEWEY